MKLTHKPTTVDGHPWNDTPADRQALIDMGFLDENPAGFEYGEPVRPGLARPLLIRTGESTEPRVALPGEYWIIRGTQAEWYCIRNEVYAACYTRQAA